MVEYGAFSNKIDHVTIFLDILNLEGHLNRITGSRVTAILFGGFCLLGELQRSGFFFQRGLSGIVLDPT